ncbi:hypothetical protein HND92_03490 [Diaphorobacter sp. JS3050]|uniref:hypothetical protein n=1 Tax=Pseudomonadota TaxID=1224 RepID=UPI0015521893|nr:MULTISPECIES: hypothetical protein [Pseudomonadota]MCZ4128624.1 hypothetical protein [Stutzerimonas balearica]QJY32140.1 hypothetical protein HND92_03490 [Diaphorobacter sp. JS3050]
MAILTASGRAALAAAIKEQTLYLALGEGDPLWDTIKAISTPFDEAGVIELGFTHLADIRVTTLDDQIEYLLDVDYSVNAREGVIRRLPDSSIPEQGDVTAHFKVAHPPEPIGQTALLREVGRRVVDEVHFVAADPEGEIVVPTGRYRLVAEPTNHLFIRVRFDFEDAATSVVREQGLFVGTQTDPELALGQKFFIPAQITDAGILLVLQNSVPIVRQPSTRETFEFVVTF